MNLSPHWHFDWLMSISKDHMNVRECNFAQEFNCQSQLSWRKNALALRCLSASAHRSAQPCNTFNIGSKHIGSVSEINLLWRHLNAGSVHPSSGSRTHSNADLNLSSRAYCHVLKKIFLSFLSQIQGVFLHFASPKKLEDGRPRLGESTLT